MIGIVFTTRYVLCTTEPSRQTITFVYMYTIILYTCIQVYLINTDHYVKITVIELNIIKIKHVMNIKYFSH